MLRFSAIKATPSIFYGMCGICMITMTYVVDRGKQSLASCRLSICDSFELLIVLDDLQLLSGIAMCICDPGRLILELHHTVAYNSLTECILHVVRSQSTPRGHRYMRCPILHKHMCFCGCLHTTDGYLDCDTSCYLFLVASSLISSLILLIVPTPP